MSETGGNPIVIKVKLASSLNWRPWLKAVRAQATRFGFLNHLNNGINNVAVGAVGGERRQQDFRNLKDAILNSLDAAVESWADARTNQIEPLSAGALVRFLRDTGHWDQQNLTQQKITDHGLQGIKFHTSEENKCIESFINARRDELRLLPMQYPPQVGLGDDDNLHHHIVDKLTGWFSPGFKQTISNIQEAVPPLTYEVMCRKLHNRLLELIREGKYKYEEGKALVISTEEAGADHNNSINNSNSNSSNSFNSEIGPNSVVMTAQALKRLKAKERKKGRDSVSATGGSFMNPDQNYGHGVFTTNYPPHQNQSHNGNNRNKGGGKGSGNKNNNSSHRGFQGFQQQNNNFHNNNPRHRGGPYQGGNNYNGNFSNSNFQNPNFQSQNFQNQNFHNSNGNFHGHHRSKGNGFGGHSGNFSYNNNNSNFQNQNFQNQNFQHQNFHNSNGNFRGSHRSKGSGFGRQDGKGKGHGN